MSLTHGMFNDAELVSTFHGAGVRTELSNTALAHALRAVAERAIEKHLAHENLAVRPVFDRIATSLERLAELASSEAQS